MVVACDTLLESLAVVQQPAGVTPDYLAIRRHVLRKIAVVWDPALVEAVRLLLRAIYLAYENAREEDFGQGLSTLLCELEADRAAACNAFGQVWPTNIPEQDALIDLLNEVELRPCVRLSLMTFFQALPFPAPDPREVEPLAPQVAAVNREPLPVARKLF